MFKKEIYMLTCFFTYHHTYVGYKSKTFYILPILKKYCSTRNNIFTTRKRSSNNEDLRRKYFLVNLSVYNAITTRPKFVANSMELYDESVSS